ncbi:MAG: hypothetical protein IJH38_00670, partial [Clostridia bacterium]|nr:hypothetical protein [Clostridia bacterium]
MQRKRKRQMYYRPAGRPGRRRPRFDFSGFLRRARWRLEDLAHSLPALPMPRRRRRYRVANRRRFMIAQGVLALTAVVALVMAGSVIVRSIRTARLNRQLVVMHTVTGDAMTAQIAAPPVGDGFESEAEAETASRASSSPYGELSAMVMPDGTPIEVEPVTAETEDTAQAGRTFRRTNLDVLPDMQKLVAANPDTMGWLSIAGTVHLPVV